MKRIIDVFLSLAGIIFLSPILATFIFLVWYQDKSSPFYISERTGLNEKQFFMIKLRSMVKDADKSNIDSTSADDMRITKVGRLIRKFKLDELTQLINVIRGDMSLVGPRPNVKRETDLYTSEERKLLSTKPGITDFASIVFSDEANILKGHKDANIAYNQLIRPGKSILGIFYVENRSTSTDLMLLVLTVVAIFSRQTALAGATALLKSIGADQKLQLLCSRKNPLIPTPPPGSNEIVTNREDRAN